MTKERWIPTVLRAGPYRFFFYSNERGQAHHVHIERDRSLAKFWLRPVALASSSGFSARELRAIERMVIEREGQLEEAWDEFFGTAS